jgi:hypothetical protein
MKKLEKKKKRKKWAYPMIFYDQSDLLFTHQQFIFFNVHCKKNNCKKLIWGPIKTFWALLL